MSYDVSLVAETGGEPAYVWDRNHTSNTSAMWRAAGCDIAEFDGMKAHELGRAAHMAYMVLLRNKGDYRSMEPRNGWGTVESTIEFLHDIDAACKKYPMTTVRVHR